MSRAAAHLGDLIGWACTINEPNVVAVMGYFQGEYPPGVKDDFARYAGGERGHGPGPPPRRRRAAGRARGRSRWASPLSMAEIVADEGGEPLRDAAEEMLENVFLRATGGRRLRRRPVLHPDALRPRRPRSRTTRRVPVTQMGDERWPQAVEHTVRRAAAVSGRPVVVTENGIATDDDTERIAFLADALRSAHRCLAEGIDLRGYFVWSLLDNFEWHLGYGPKFGLVAVAPGTFERRPKPSAALVRRGGPGQPAGHSGLRRAVARVPIGSPGVG